MISRYFPILTWSRNYTRDTFVNDTVAAVIVTIMLIPQSLAYALLAGLPPEVGLYASIAPLLLYTLWTCCAGLQDVPTRSLEAHTCHQSA